MLFDDVDITRGIRLPTSHNCRYRYGIDLYMKRDRYSGLNSDDGLNDFIRTHMYLVTAERDVP